MIKFQKLSLTLLTGMLLTSSAWSQSWLPAYNRLLHTYSSDRGINYTKWKKNSNDVKQLEKIVSVLATQIPPDTNDAREIAYYANAYNILVIHGVLQNYPIRSVKDVAANFGFFSQKNFTLGGRKVSLNDIEKVRLLKQFGDARIHFIVNCASISCPSVPIVALTPENVDYLMDASATDFLNKHQDGIRIHSDGSYSISKLFDWYANDFEASSGSIVTFINRYRNSPIPEKAKIRYLDYDWGLNQFQ
ncbi:MAG: DUF547 domain-containing protein [Verrucomicrobiota bacterium]